MYTFVKEKKSISQNKFDKIAKLLLNGTVLKINDNNYRICEIEFYLRNEDHDDEYTHCNEDQSQFGKWYFHKYKNGTYKSGTYKGLDLTLGTKDKYCGILIRSIYNIDDDEFITGPCKSVNKVLEEYSKKSVEDFTKNKLLSAIENKHNFVLEDSELEKEEIYVGKRVGLSDKYPEFADRNYRYLIMKDKIKKQKKDLKKLKL